MNKIFFIKLIDRKIGGDKMKTNRYFASMTLFLCAIIGGAVGSCTYLNNLFDADINISLTHCLGCVVMLIGLNIAESIMATDDVKDMVVRSAVICLLLAVGFGIGLLASFVILIIVTLVLGIWFLGTLFGMLLGGTPSTGGRGKKVILEDGTVLTNEQSDLLGGGVSYRGDDGNTYHSDDGEHFEQR